VSFG
jgi:hypothetical protein